MAKDSCSAFLVIFHFFFVLDFIFGGAEVFYV